MDGREPINSSTWACPRTRPGRTLTLACLSLAASRGRTPAMKKALSCFLPAGLNQYVLNNYTNKPLPYHVKQDDTSASLQRLEVDRINGSQSVRGRGGIITVTYGTHWRDLLRPSWGREIAHRTCVIASFATGPEDPTNITRPTICTAVCALALHTET